MIEDLQRNMGINLYDFEYVDELIDHIIQSDQVNLYDITNGIFDEYIGYLEDYNISYDEFKHNFSVYLIKNYRKNKINIT